EVMPPTGTQQIGDIGKSIDREQPHEEEMPCHSDSKMKRKRKEPVEPIWKEVNQRCVPGSNSVDVVGPINHQPAPDHQKQQRKIHPVEPPDGERMFIVQRVHFLFFCSLVGIVMVAIFVSIGILSNISAFCSGVSAFIVSVLS